jgi:hypothetical protein
MWVHRFGNPSMEPQRVVVNRERSLLPGLGELLIEHRVGIARGLLCGYNCPASFFFTEQDSK